MIFRTELVAHVKAATGLAITATTLPLAWVSNIELPLRLILTIVGIGSGISAWRYYSAARRNLK